MSKLGISSSIEKLTMILFLDLNLSIGFKHKTQVLLHYLYIFYTKLQVQNSENTEQNYSNSIYVSCHHHPCGTS